MADLREDENLINIEEIISDSRKEDPEFYEELREIFNSNEQGIDTK